MRYAILATIAICLAACANTLQPNVPSYDFGKVLVGTSSTSSDIHWTNQGKNIVTVTTVGGSIPPFSLWPAAYPANSVGVSQNTSQIRVVFAPTTAGSFKTSLVPVGYDTPGRPVSAGAVRVEGQAVAQISTENAYYIGVPNDYVGKPVDFGRVVINTGPATEHTISIANATTSDVEVYLKFYGSVFFKVVNPPPSPFTLKALNNQEVKVKFLPSKVGKFFAHILFMTPPSPPATEPVLMAATSLTGEGIAPADEESEEDH